MKRFRSLGRPQAVELCRSLLLTELSLMEQGTLLGFLLSFANNILMLLVFHLLFVNRFLDGVPNSWVYLLLGIVQWNLYVNVSLAGFSCMVYRQKIVMGYSFPRELLVIARTGAVFVPYLVELFLILCVARYFRMPITWKYLLLPVMLAAQFLFCAGLCSLFAIVGVLHRNVIPFWNVMFRLISFATPIFYLPGHLGPLANLIYSWNPFTIYMMWVRDIVGANGFPIHFTAWKIAAGSIGVFLLGYTAFRAAECKIGDSL
ncbi:MAG TPA: ABC transporter permease [Bdellovibrionota bacterium]|jgi:ABC-type polysaccharide/polyol phosphate export permease